MQIRPLANAVQQRVEKWRLRPRKFETLGSFMRKLKKKFGYKIVPLTIFFLEQEDGGWGGFAGPADSPHPAQPSHIHRGEDEHQSGEQLPHTYLVQSTVVRKWRYSNYTVFQSVFFYP